MTEAQPEEGSCDQLDRAQEAIDEAKAGERNALGDLDPGPDVDEPYTGEGIEPEEGVARGF